MADTPKDSADNYGAFFDKCMPADTPSSLAEPRPHICGVQYRGLSWTFTCTREAGHADEHQQGQSFSWGKNVRGRPAPSSSGETPAAATSSADMDDLLHAFQSACAAVVSEGDSNISRTTKERAILRNELRARLFGVAERDAECARLRAEVERLQAVIDAMDGMRAAQKPRTPSPAGDARGA